MAVDLAGQIGAHTFRPLRQHLKRMLRRQRHDGEDLVDPFFRHFFGKKVAMGANEDHARAFPAQRIHQRVTVEPHCAVPDRPGLAYRRQAFAARMVLQRVPARRMA